MTELIREQHAGESLFWEFDVAAQLPPAATLASVTSASLTNLKTGASYAAGLSGSPSVSGSKVRQRVIALEAGQLYRLTWLFLDSAGNTQAAGLTLKCLW